MAEGVTVPEVDQTWRRNSTGEKLVVERVWKGYARLVWPHDAHKYIDIHLSKFGHSGHDGFTFAPSKPGRRTAAASCFYCAKPGTILCDGVLAISRSDDGSPARRTCDRHLCDDHSFARGALFIRIRGKCSADSFDYCPQCVEEGRDKEGFEAPSLSLEEAAALFRQRQLRLHPTHKLAPK